MLMQSIRCSVAALLLFSTPLFAQATLPSGPGLPPVDESPDSAAVRKASKDFMLSLAGDDLADAKKKFAGSDSDFKSVETMHGLFVAAKHLRTTAENKWPDLAKQPKSNDMDPKALADRIDHQNPRIDGDSASFPGGSKLQKINGEWKVVDVVGDPQAKLMMMTMFGAMTTAVDDTTKQIEAGQYATWQEAQDGMRSRMQEIMRAQMSTIMPGRPTTRPNGARK